MCNPQVRRSGVHSRACARPPHYQSPRHTTRSGIRPSETRQPEWEANSSPKEMAI